MNLNLSNSNPRGILVGVALLAAVFLSYFSIRNARAIHYASLQTPEGLDRSTQLEPRDARNWYLLGRYWQYNLENPDTPRAIRSYLSSLAVNQASADTWLDLAMAYETEGNIPAARDAFLHARRAYPLSAEGAWRYGNFLLRQGQLQPAFLEMRHSVEADPNRGAEAFSRSLRADPNIDRILNEVLPPISNVYVDVIRDQVNEGKTDNALKVWERLAGIRPRLSLGDIFTFVDTLRTKKQISDARRVWHQAVNFSGFSNLQGPSGSLLWDGGFESGISGAGFAWLIPQDSPAVQIRRDPREKRSGNHSLRLMFTGSSNVNFNGVCHYVPGEAAPKY
jgi:tetratricopeptide (TPR) repeat protein